MYARIGTWEGTPDELERWTHRSRTEVAPQVRSEPGSRGVLLLLDREQQRALTITLWESGELMAASEAHRAALQHGTTEASGARVKTARYEVVHADLEPVGSDRREETCAG